MPGSASRSRLLAVMLAEAVVAVLADHERMSRAARSAARRFAIPAYVDRVENLLKR